MKVRFVVQMLDALGVTLCLFDILLSDRHVITSDYDPMRAYPTPMT